MIRKKYDNCMNYRISQYNVRDIRSKPMEKDYHQYGVGYIQGLNMIQLIGNPEDIFLIKKEDGGVR